MGERRRRRFGGFRRAASPLPRARVSPRGGRGVVEERARAGRSAGLPSPRLELAIVPRIFARRFATRWRRRRIRSARGSPPRRRRARNTSLSIFKDASLRFIGRSVARSPIRPVVPRDARSSGPAARSRPGSQSCSFAKQVGRDEDGETRAKNRETEETRASPLLGTYRVVEALDFLRKATPATVFSLAADRWRANGRRRFGVRANSRRRRRAARRRRWTPTTTRAPSKTRTKAPRGSPSRRRARGGRGDATGRARVDVPSPRGDPRSRRRFGSRRRARRSTRVGRQGDSRDRRREDAGATRFGTASRFTSQNEANGTKGTNVGPGTYDAADAAAQRLNTESARRGFRRLCVQIRIQIRTRRRRRSATTRSGMSRISIPRARTREWWRRACPRRWTFAAGRIRARTRRRDGRAAARERSVL